MQADKHEFELTIVWTRPGDVEVVRLEWSPGHDLGLEL
jgi:hypothetical protein